MTDIPWRKGPSVPLLNNLKVFEIRYRWRKEPEDEWTYGKLEMVERNEEMVRRRVLKFLSKRRILAEIPPDGVKFLTDEHTLQTGGPVEQVPQEVYEKAREKLIQEMEENEKDIDGALRAMGLHPPPKHMRN